MSLLSTMDISASGLSCERKRMEIIAQNIAHIETTRAPGEEPYRRQVPVFREVVQTHLNAAQPGSFKGRGVEVARVVADNAPPLAVYDPHHPHANQEGLILKPNISLADEIVDSITASRAYAANVTVFNATKSMALKTLTIGRG